MFQKGDRIVLEGMEDDPCPVPVGTEGTVQFCHRIQMDNAFWQVSIDWDNGSNLMLCIPPDRVRLSN